MIDVQMNAEHVAQAPLLDQNLATSAQRFGEAAEVVVPTEFGPDAQALLAYETYLAIEDQYYKENFRRSGALSQGTAPSSVIEGFANALGHPVTVEDKSLAQ